MKKILLLSVLLSLSTLSNASEDMYGDSWYSVTGVNLMDGSDRLDVENSSLGYSLKLGKPISKNWDIQAGISHVESDEDSNKFSNGNYRQSLIGVDAIYLLNRESRFTPIFLVGGGLAYNKVDYSSATGNFGGGNYSWMANAGAGFQYKINDTFGLQTDVRRVWSDADYDGARHTVGNDYLNVGLIYKFGASKKVAVANKLPEPTLQLADLNKGPEPYVFVHPEKITLSSEVLFEFNSAKLKETGKSKLNDDVVVKLLSHKEIDLVLITGHTDRIGSESFNQTLSEKRAEAVKDYLVGNGIAESRLQATGAGESSPVVQCNDKSRVKLIKCLEPNRRVEIELGK